jgi:hypothetical protein
MRNEQLFRDVADAIEAEPERYDQAEWERETECGTTRCIAGWAAWLGARVSFLQWQKGRHPEWVPFFSDGVESLLGLTAEEGDDLFHTSWRPHDGLFVPDALRKIGEGAAIEDVSA